MLTACFLGISQIKLPSWILYHKPQLGRKQKCLSSAKHHRQNQLITMRYHTNRRTGTASLILTAAKGCHKILTQNRSQPLPCKLRESHFLRRTERRCRYVVAKRNRHHEITVKTLPETVNLSHGGCGTHDGLHQFQHCVFGLLRINLRPQFGIFHRHVHVGLGRRHASSHFLCYSHVEPPRSSSLILRAVSSSRCGIFFVRFHRICFIYAFLRHFLVSSPHQCIPPQRKQHHYTKTSHETQIAAETIFLSSSRW